MASFGSGKFDLPEGDWVHHIVDSKAVMGDGFLSEADKKAGKTAEKKEQFEWATQYWDGSEWKERKIWTGNRFLPIGSIKSAQFTPAIHRLCKACKSPIPQSKAEAEAFGIGEPLYNRTFIVRMQPNPENPEELKEYWVQNPDQEAAPGADVAEPAKPQAPKAAPKSAPKAPPVPAVAAAAVSGADDAYE